MKRFLLALCLLPSLCWAQTPYESHITNLYAPTVFYYGSEASGNIINHGNFGTPSNYNLAAGTAPTYGQAGVNSARGNSLLFASASSQYMHVNRNDTGSGPFDTGNGAGHAFECWFKLAATGTATALMATGTGEANNTQRVMQFVYNGTKLDFILYQGAGGSPLVYINSPGATTLSSGTWYMGAATWTVSGTTEVVYLNGVQDSTNSTPAGGSAPNAVQFIAMGSREGDLGNYMNGNIQDCAVYGVASTAASILDRYNYGIRSFSTVWPFLTERPHLPTFRDDDYWHVTIRDGYNTGHFLPRALKPQYLLTGYYPIFPDGNTGRR